MFEKVENDGISYYEEIDSKPDTLIVFSIGDHGAGHTAQFFGA